MRAPHCRVGLLRIIDLEEIFYVDGVPILNGMFCVHKRLDENEKRICRLIMNSIPSNAYQRQQSSSSRTLSSPQRWCLLHVSEEHDLAFRAEDHLAQVLFAQVAVHLAQVFRFQQKSYIEQTGRLCRSTRFC